MQAEDDASTTIRRNLEAMGADVTRVHVYDKRVLAQDPLYLPDASQQIAEVIEEHNARLLVIDPITSFVSGNVNSDQAVRKALQHLMGVASRTRTAILVVRHLTKGGNKNALYRGAGSIALVGVARSVLRVGVNPDNDNERLLVRIKCNIDRPVRSLRYQIVEEENGVRVEWLGQSPYTAADLDARHADRPAMDEAKEFLCQYLALGELWVGDIRRAASETGISWATLRRAKLELGITHRRSGFGPGHGFYWRLDFNNEYVRKALPEDVLRRGEVEAQRTLPSS